MGLGLRSLGLEVGDLKFREFETPWVPGIMF